MDKKTKKQRSENMRRIRSTDSLPEMIVRRTIYKLGYRYRLHNNKMPGRPDIMLAKLNKIIFVNGCFWHCHKKCSDGHIPKSRLAYWKPKLERNVKRDIRNRSLLRNLGWKILVVWECETKDLNRLTKKVSRFLKN
jgi:DNA mismatch endonuclease (patch repair protein)